MQSTLKSLLFSLLAVAVFSNELPKDITKCQAGDVVCISRVGTELIKKHHGGRPDIGLPSIDPYILPKLDVEAGSTNLAIRLKDITVKGLKNLVIERAVGFERDPKKSKFEMYAKVPKLQLVGNFNADGQILNFPVKGDGVFDILLEKVKIGIKFKPKISVIDNKSYLSVDKIKSLVEPENLKVNLKRNSNESDALNASLNEFLNQNWKELWKQLYPDISNAIIHLQREFIDSILQNYAYESIYL